MGTESESQKITGGNLSSVSQLHIRFSRSVVSNPLQPHGLQHARLYHSITNSQSLLKPMSIESVMPSSPLILCCPLLLPPLIFPSIRIFSSESPLHQFGSVQFSRSVVSDSQSCPTLCNPMNRSSPGLPVHHQLPEFIQLISIESVIPSNHLILCHPLLLLPPIFPSIRVLSNESALRIRWPKFGASASVLPMNIQD